MTPRRACEDVDELAGAWVLGALPPAEELAVADHLADCDRPHAELRELVGAADMLAMSLPPETPSPALRSRIMRSIQPTTQPTPAGGSPRRWALSALAGLAAAAALVLAAWNVQLSSDLRQREAELGRLADAIAAGDAAHRASGSAGSGYLIDAERPVLVASLPPAPQGRLYEMWLLDAAGEAVAVGTFEGSEDQVVVVELERSLSGFTTFAITVEEGRVVAPTGDPVLVAPLSG